MSKSNETTPNVPTLRFRFNNDKWAEYPNSVLFSISSKKNHDGKESLVLSALLNTIFP